MVDFAPIPQLQLNLATEPGRLTLAFFLFVVGDSATTAIGLSMGAVEQHPFSLVVLGMGGLVGMILWKLFVFGSIRGVAQFIVPEQWRMGVTMGLAISGLMITMINLYIIFHLV